MSNIKGNKSNMLSFEQKLIGAKDSNNNPIPWKDLAKKHNVSYSAARNWSLGYEEFGKDFLRKISSRKDQNAGVKKENHYKINSKNSKLRELAKLKKQNKELEMQVFLLKKLQEYIEE